MRMGFGYGARVDPIDTPPTDHGSDRYDYVELDAPPGVRPIGQWWDDLIAAPCPDCRANVFARWLGPDPAQYQLGAVHFGQRANWHVTYAHDEQCPQLARLEAD